MIPRRINRVGVGAMAAAVFGALALAPARAATVSVQGPPAATPGGVLTIEVALSPDLNAIHAIQGALTYDPNVLTLLSAEEDAPQGFRPGEAAPYPGETAPRDTDLFRMNAAGAGRVLFGYVKNPSGPAAMPATALRLTFGVAEGATGFTTVALTPYTVNGRDLPAVLLGDALGVPVAAGAGVPLVVALTLWGDADGDGAVTAADALLAARVAGGQAGDDAIRMENADVWPADAPDGRVTLEDALRIARFASGLEAEADGRKK